MDAAPSRGLPSGTGTGGGGVVIDRAEVNGVDRVRACPRHALRAAPDVVTARVTVFSRHQDAVLRGEPTEPDLAVTTTAPLAARTAPVRLRRTPYERDLPHVKRAGTFGLSLRRRRAVLAGYDDVLFTDRDGRVGEASISNIAFFADGHVLWPEAAVLPGITMRLLQRGLAAEGIPSGHRDLRLPDLTPSLAAFLTNSISPAVPVTSIDDTALTVDPELTALLVKCYASNPWQPVQHRAKALPTVFRDTFRPAFGKLTV